jgi:hypothetical protein
MMQLLYRWVYWRLEQRAFLGLGEALDAWMTGMGRNVSGCVKAAHTVEIIAAAFTQRGSMKSEMKKPMNDSTNTPVRTRVAM